MKISPQQLTVGSVSGRKQKAICIGEGYYKKIVGYFTSEEAYAEFIDYIDSTEGRRAYIREEIKVRVK